jgi:hypothetical protein
LINPFKKKEKMAAIKSKSLTRVGAWGAGAKAECAQLDLESF